MSDGDGSSELQKIGQYQLLKQLGKGGMGSVWLSEHPFLKIPCAIKILDAKLAGSSEFVQRFILEGRLAAELNHPNIVRVFDANHEGDLFYMVLEFVDGCDVKQMADQRGGKLPVDEVLEIAWKVGGALKEAASHNIIHRDIKPENIMVTSDGDLKLADLGIGKKIDEEEEYSLTMTGTAIGTAYYLSPEQGKDSKSIDHRSDIYSLGATMYKLLTGTFPFRANTPMAMIIKHVNEPLEDPRKRNSDVPDNIAGVICKMMEKNPDDRYQTYDEFLSDIEAIRNMNAPVESLTCSMPGIPNNTPVPEPKKKVMHVSKKVHKHAEERSHKKSSRPKQKKSKNKTLIYGLVAAIVLLFGVVIKLATDNEPRKIAEKTEVEPRKETVKKSNVRKTVKTNSLTNNSLSNFDENRRPKIENLKTEDALIEDLERKLRVDNVGDITIKDYVFDQGRITALDLHNNPTLRNISALEGLPLVYLNLNNCPNVMSIDSLANSDLIELTMVNSQPGSLDNLEALKNTQLEKLTISNMPELSYLTPLSKLPLKELHLNDCPKIKSLSALRSNNTLEIFEHSNSMPSKLSSLSGLEKAPLKSLRLDNCPSVRSLQAIINCPLDKITISDCGISEQSLEVLFQMPLNQVETDHENFNHRYLAFIDNGRIHPQQTNIAANTTNPIHRNEPELSLRPNENLNFNPGHQQNNEPAGFGNVKVRALFDGALYVDNKKLQDIAKGQVITIPKLKAGERQYTFRSKNLKIDGKWNIFANDTINAMIPNSSIAMGSKGLSSTKISKIMAGRLPATRAKVEKFFRVNQGIEHSTDKAYKWLAKQQNDRGEWGDGGHQFLSTLAVTAFLCKQENLFNNYAENLDKALINIRQSIRDQNHMNDEFPINVLALAEAYALTNNKALKIDVANGVEALLKCQTKYGVFAPHDPNANEHSMIFSPWAFEALKAAYYAGVETTKIKKALSLGGKSLSRFYQKSSQKDGPFIRYCVHHPGPGGPGPGGQHFDPSEIFFMRAAGASSLMMSGYTSSKLTPLIQQIYRKDIDMTLNWRNPNCRLPGMTWYLSTQAVFNYGGTSWNKWQERLMGQYMDNQDREGFWDSPNGDEEQFFHGNRENARIFMTCLSILNLNTFYRYAPSKKLQ